ncbi:hypothetical protein D1872_209070 [compost metagenome]
MHENNPRKGREQNNTGYPRHHLGVGMNQVITEGTGDQAEYRRNQDAGIGRNRCVDGVQ